MPASPPGGVNPPVLPDPDGRRKLPVGTVTPWDFRQDWYLANWADPVPDAAELAVLDDEEDELELPHAATSVAAGTASSVSRIREVC